MFTTTPHLRAQRPAPDVAQYTVSNAPHRRSMAARALFALAIVIRAVAVLMALGFWVAKWVCRGEATGGARLTFGQRPSPVEQWDATSCRNEWVGRIALLLFDRAALAQPWEFVVPLGLVVIYLCFRRYHTEESLLVVRTLGIQTATTSQNYLSGSTTRFIPTSQIQDIFIHEAFIGFEVRYYLAIVVEGETELTVVFPNLLPKLAIVEEVWRGARACLFESRPKSATRDAR